MPQHSDPHIAGLKPRTFVVDDVQPAVNAFRTQPLANHISARFMREVVFLPQPDRAVVGAFQEVSEPVQPAVKAPEQPIASPQRTQSIWNQLSAGLKRKIALRPQPDRPVVSMFGSVPDASKPTRPAILKTTHVVRQPLVSRTHPLIDAVHLAFSRHYPLTLSPDAIWLTIEQGFAHHIAENAEALRHRLVRHTSKCELVEHVTALNLTQLQGAIAGFSSQIRAASDPVLHETLVCDFSTTTPEVRTASEIVLMDCYASYFTYAIMCICGIPKITIAGTPEDWRSIRARIEVLATFNLDWWATRLRPILDQFIATAEGNADRAFWQAIYKPKQAYGSEVVTGWIADLFPYLGSSSIFPGCQNRRRSHIFDHERTDWYLPGCEGVSTVGFDPSSKLGVGIRGFPSGLASVPIRLMFRGATHTEMELDFVGGFLGVEQDAGLSLAPVISWAVTQRAPAQPVMVPPV